MDKDVHRTDRQQPFFSEPRSHNTKQLRNILLTYVQYNHDLGYCQVSMRCCCTCGIASVLSHSPSCTAVTAVHARAMFLDPHSVHSQIVTVAPTSQVVPAEPT